MYSYIYNLKDTIKQMKLSVEKHTEKRYLLYHSHVLLAGS